MSLTVEGTTMRVNLPNQIATYAAAERRSEFAKRVADSVCRVLDSTCGRGTRDAVFWNLSITRNIGQGDIADKPAIFMESLHEIFGSLTRTLEEAMVEELRIEFGRTSRRPPALTRA
jgi:hypothetical protein